MGFITMNPPIRQNSFFFFAASKWCKSKILKEVYGYLGCSFTPIYTLTTFFLMETVYILNHQSGTDKCSHLLAHSARV